MADLSFIANPLVPQQIDPTDVANHLAALQNARNQNQLFQQQFNDRQVISNAYKGATDPTTGQVDYNKLVGNITQSGAGYLVPEALKGAQENAQRQLQQKGMALEQGMKRANYMGSVYSSLLAKDNITQADLINVGAQAVSDGILTNEEFVKGLATAPSDPKQLRGWVQQKYLTVMSPEGRMNAIYGQQHIINQGGQQTVAQFPQMGGAPQVLGTMQNTPAPTMQDTGKRIVPTSGGRQIGPGLSKETTPADDAEIVDIVNAAGEKTPITKGELRRRLSGEGDFGSGRYSGGGAPPEPIRTGLAPGVSEAAAGAAKTAVEQADMLAKTAGSVPDRRATLGGMLSAVNDFTPGPGAGNLKTLRAAFGRYGLDWDEKATSSQEQFVKNANQIAMQQAAALGGRASSDLELKTAMGANPSVELSKAGLVAIIHKLQGNEDAVEAKNSAWQASGQSPGNHTKWSAEFNKTFDPRVFQFQYMKPEEQADAYKNMAEPDKKRFLKAYKAAIKQKMVPDPTAPE